MRDQPAPLTDTFVPERIFSYNIPIGATWGIRQDQTLPHSFLLAIERLIPTHSFLGAWVIHRQLLTHHPERNPVPPTQAAQAAAPTARRRRPSNTAELTAAFTALVASCDGKGWRTVQPPPIARWKTLLASPPGTDMVHVFTQPPAPIAKILALLWANGMRVHGFVWADSFLSTRVASPEHIGQVKLMVGWLNGYINCAPLVGLPPPPWRLVAARSLTEHIASYDSVGN